ncbi:glycoside hydrolase family 2 protein [Glaciibacter psychrotolerans]|uniref:Surface antigen n=1 Tax=Glaciibacter psychrotolerans TaxID=670054 RepID=A0A7Z0EEV2_9MICO|nr:sugar-binding domain-containing protein [Leifsonia psychrotolerans]NYJ20367.1 surface antigen [Leifsonia psychrotolerans]
MIDARIDSSRPTLDLDGEWSLSYDGGNDTGTEMATVIVPGPWTTQVDGQGDSHASVVYNRTFDVAEGWARDRTTHLMFGGVNRTASVTLNGHHLGTHVGAWTPFEFELGEALRAGSNDLRVEVSYPPRMGTADEAGFTEVPHGKQTWYGTSAGIWQSVSIEARVPQHLGELIVRADAATGTVRAAVTLARPAQAGESLTITATRVGETDAVATAVRLPLDGAATTAELSVGVDAPQLWSPDDPQRYAVTVSVHSADGTDSQTRTTGFRTISTQGGEVLFNGKPIEIRAVLDQDYHLGSSTIPESDEALEALFAETKRLGFNMLRCHIKRPDQRYYDLADRLGLLVWAELPSWLTMTTRGAAEGAQLLADLIALDGHHPSIVIWTVINESWGIDLRDAAQRAWLRETFDAVKALAPESLIVDNSACEPNFHLKSDLDDFHVYRGIPESRVSWDEKIADFATRPDWTYSPYGDAERVGDEPLLLSEYGNWALPHALDQYGPDGAEPWWFANGAHWAFGAAEGTGLAQRFIDLGLDEVFGTWDNLVDALHHAQMVANRYQTGSIRSHASISGYVLTQLSDVQWEANGLFDMMRSPKKYNEDFRLVNGEFAVVFRPDVYSAESGEVIGATSSIVPPRPLGNLAGVIAELRLSVAGQPVQSVPVRLDERAAIDASLTLPGVAGEIELAAELWVDGELRARDAATIVVIAAESARVAAPGAAAESSESSGPAESSAPGAPPRTVRAADAELEVWLRTLGIATQPGSGSNLADADDLIVTRAFDAAAQAHARRGGRVLVLAEDSDALSDAFDYLPVAKLGRRDGDGDWVPRQEWLRRDGAFAALPGGPLLGIAYEDLLGDLVINGIPAAMRPAQVHSAIFSGWLRHAATTTATVAWSDGEVTITTFKVRTQADATPLARALGRALVAHAART